MWNSGEEHRGAGAQKKEAVNKQNDTWQVVNYGGFFFFFFFKGKILNIPAREEEEMETRGSRNYSNCARSVSASKSERETEKWKERAVTSKHDE